MTPSSLSTKSRVSALTPYFTQQRYLEYSLHHSNLGEYVLLAVLILPDTGGGTVHEPVGPQQGQDNVPHDGKIIAMSLVLKSQAAVIRDAGKIVDGKQIFTVPCTSSSVWPRRSTAALSKENFTFIL